MFTVFIGNDDPELIEVLAEGDHINPIYYRDNICIPLIKILKQKACRRQITWYHNNASSHTATSEREFFG